MSRSKSYLGIKDIPTGWRAGDYQKDALIGDRGGLFEYIAYGGFRAAVFHNFRCGPEGYGVFIFAPQHLEDWTLFGDVVSTHAEALHLMVAYAQLGAFDAYLK
jgi:hypothetical protein